MDYNIYIHSVDNYNNGNMTTPWGGANKKGSPTSAWVSPEEQVGSEGGDAFGLKSPTQLLESGKDAFSKAIPEVALSMAVVLVAKKAIDTTVKTIDATLPFYVAETGNYYLSTEWNNLKSIVGAVKNPFGTFYNTLRLVQQTRLENQRRTMQREILGDSMINTYSNRGV